MTVIRNVTTVVVFHNTVTDVWVDLVLLKVLNLSFELKPIPLFGLQARPSGNDQPINHAWMILVSMNDSK
jgi:hypothetical protein